MSYDNWDNMLKKFKNGNIKSKKLVHLAGIQNRLDMIKEIEKIDKDVLKLGDEDGNTCSHISAKYGYIDMLKYCINKNGDLVNNNGDSVLHLADPSLYKYLDKADPNIINKHGYTPLTLNIKNTTGNDIYFEGIKQLLDMGAKLDIPPNISPLHYAVTLNKLNIVELLLKHNADINMLGEHNLSPLNIAVYNKNPKITKYLLEHGADPNHGGIEGEHNPLILSINNGKYKITKMLLEHGSDINGHDRYLDTPLHIALMSGDRFPKELLFEMIYRGDLNKKNIYGTTPLHLIFKKENWRNYKEVMKDKDINLFMENSKKKKPLDNVDKKDVPEIIDMVVDSYLNKKGITPPRCKYDKNKCRDIVKRNMMRMKTMTPDVDKDISMVVGKKANVGLFNSNTLHSIIYTICILDKHKSLMIPFQYYNLDKATNTKMLLEMASNYQSPIINDLLSIYLDYLHQIVPFIVLWKDKHNYHIDDNLDLYIKKLLNTKIRYIYIKVTLIPSGHSSHANMIFVDLKKKCAERFEPYGVVKHLDIEEFDKIMEDIFKEFKIKYMRPQDYMPNVSFQTISNDSNIEVKKLGDPAGYCLAWTFWYMEMRIKNPHLNPDKLIQHGIDEIINTNNGKTSFVDFIRNYSTQLNNMKNNLIKEAGVSEKHIYDMIPSDKNLDKILNHISSKFNKLVESI